MSGCLPLGSNAGSGTLACARSKFSVRQTAHDAWGVHAWVLRIISRWTSRNTSTSTPSSPSLTGRTGTTSRVGWMPARPCSSTSSPGMGPPAHSSWSGGWRTESRDWYAEFRRPGHEIASHSWWHRRVPTLSPANSGTTWRDQGEARGDRRSAGPRVPRGQLLDPARAWSGPSTSCSRPATPTTPASSQSAARAMAGPARPPPPYDIVRPAAPSESIR